jgi:hypothetical protein
VYQNGTENLRGAAPRQGSRRGASRHAHAEHVTVTTQWGAQAGSLMDLSTSGAQVRLANGLVPIEGDDVTLRLVDGRHLAGSVVWADRGAIGIRFETTLSSLEEILWLEQRGADWFYASVRAQRA